MRTHNIFLSVPKLWHIFRYFFAPLIAILVIILASQTAVSQESLLVAENSWIRVQNVGDDPAMLEVSHYGRGGNAAASEICPGEFCAAVPPGSGWTFFTETNLDLAAGFYGSTKITGEQPFVAVAGKDSLTSGTDGWYLTIGGDSYWQGGASYKLILPLVEYTAEKSSVLHIQNASSDSPTCIVISYFIESSLDIIALEPDSSSVQCPEGGLYLEPNESIVRNRRSFPFEIGFSGSAIIETTPVQSGDFLTSASEQAIVASVDTVSADGISFSSYRGFANSEAGKDIVLPIVQRGVATFGDFGGEIWSTRFRITAANPSVSTTANILFNGAMPDGTEFEADHEVSIYSSITCDQDMEGLDACLPDQVSLPSGFSGTVRISSDQNIAVVVQRISESGISGDYRGFTAREAGTQVVLPVVNKTLSPWGGHDGWNSTVHVQPFDGGSATVSFFYFSKDLPKGGFYRSVGEIVGSKTVHQGDDRFLPDDWIGSLIVVSTRPVVVLANLENAGFKGDPIMMYNGVSLE